MWLTVRGLSAVCKSLGQGKQWSLELW